MSMNREKNIQIAEDTLRIIKNGYYYANGKRNTLVILADTFRKILQTWKSYHQVRFNQLLMMRTALFG